eukprot:PITA_22572
MKMKNISPSALPHFHGFTTEDPDTFLFEFDVLCRTYDYAEDEKKLKLFPSTLKDVALRWFMGLPGNSITTWAQMQQVFNNKYREYCREARKRGRGNPLSASTTFSKHEFTNQMEDLKSEMRQTIPMQLDTFRIQQKKEEAERALAIFCPRCTRKHPKNECPLHSVEAIKDVPIYKKLIKENFFRHPSRRKRDAPTIDVIGQLSDLMLGQVICLKYLDPRSPVVDFHINGTIIPHTLIDLGVAINVMTRDTMLKLNLQSSLRKASTVLQLADCSTVTLKGIVEDVLVSVDSWEYPADFLVL